MVFDPCHIAEIVAVWRHTKPIIYEYICEHDYDLLVDSRIIIQKSIAQIFRGATVDLNILSTPCANAIRACRDKIVGRDLVDAFANYIETHPNIPAPVLAADDTGANALRHEVRAAFYFLWQNSHISVYRLEVAIAKLARVPTLHIISDSTAQADIEALISRYQIVTMPTMFAVEPSRLITQLVTYIENAPPKYSIITSKDAFFILIVLAAVHGFTWTHELTKLPHILQSS